MRRRRRQRLLDAHEVELVARMHGERLPGSSPTGVGSSVISIVISTDESPDRVRCSPPGRRDRDEMIVAAMQVDLVQVEQHGMTNVSETEHVADQTEHRLDAREDDRDRYGKEHTDGNPAQDQGHARLAQV